MRRFLVAILLAGIGIWMGAAPVAAESGYASPRFELWGSTYLDCLDTSPAPNLYDRTQDTFACVGPAGTVQASGTLWQVMWSRYPPYSRLSSWGAVTFRCAPSPGPYDRYVSPGRYTNLACSRSTA